MHACMHAWMKAWTDGWMNEWISEWKNEWTSAWMNVWTKWNKEWMNAPWCSDVPYVVELVSSGKLQIVYQSWLLPANQRHFFETRTFFFDFHLHTLADPLWHRFGKGVAYGPHRSSSPTALRSVTFRSSRSQTTALGASGCSSERPKYPWLAPPTKKTGQNIVLKALKLHT